MKIKDRIQGSLYSGALGDAIGSLFENQPAGSFYSIEELPQLSITDDTQLSLATCEAIIAEGKVDPEAIAKNFLRVFKENGIKGIGSSTLKAMRDLEAGAHWYLAGNRSEMSAGNGAAMRIAPIGFCLDIPIDDLPFLVRDVCTITHKNDEAYAGALAVCLSVRFLIEGISTRDLPLAISEYLPDTKVRDALSILDQISSISIKDASKITGTGGYVVESVPLALFSALKAQEIGILEMIETIISCGGDADTTASMASQIAGSYLGTPVGIHNLMKKVIESEYITKVVSEFASVVQARAQPVGRGQ